MSATGELSFTLITVCWNAAETIGRTIQSVASQPILPAEYIFVDGGSSDCTTGIISASTPWLESSGVRVRLRQQQRLPGQAGITSAWNQALREATGDIIAILNADDCYLPDALQRVHDAFADDDGVDAVAGAISWHDEQGRDLGCFRPRPLRLLPYLMPVPHPACFFRRRLYQSIGEYDASYRLSADYDFVWRAVRSHCKWRFLDDTLVAMQAGGAANANRGCARRETYRIARRHLPWYDPRPLLALVARIITRR